MQMITPIDIDDTNMTSSVAEPDASQGEEVWVDASGDYYTDVVNDGNFYYCIASNNSTDYVLRSNGSTTYIDKYIDGAFDSTASGGADQAFDCAYINGSILALTSVSIVKGYIYDTSDLTFSTISVSGEPSGASYSFVCVIGSIVYMYDYTNESMDSFTLSGSTLTYTETLGDITLSDYSTLTSNNDGNILALIGNVVYEYSTGLVLISETTLSDMDDTETFRAGISNNNDSGIRVLSLADNLITLYNDDLTFGGGYTTGDQVILTDTHTLYQSVIDNNFDEPVVGSALTAPSWVEVSATNKYRAFDYTINTVSTMTTSSAEITLTPGEICTTISLYGLGDISTVYIKVYNGSTSGTLLYDESQDLTINQPVEDSIVNDNYYRDKVMFDDLPATYSNPHIVITFDSAEDEIEVGDVVIGNARTMGAMVYESSTTRTSYDTVDTDDYGNETITSRPSAEYTTFELFVEPEYADYVERMLKSSLNKIRVYVGDKNSTEKLFTLGYYERSPITYDAPMKCSTTLKVRGLV